MKGSVISHQLNESNWTFCCFQLGRHKAFVSLGGEPGDSNELSKINLIYYATISDFDGNQVDQKPFPNLVSAIAFLNQMYGHWPFVDQTKSESGCDSCHAH